MAKIIGLEELKSGLELQQELQRGAKFVTYQYCISILIMTFKEHLLRPGRSESRDQGAGILVIILFPRLVGHSLGTDLHCPGAVGQFQRRQGCHHRGAGFNE